MALPITPKSRVASTTFASMGTRCSVIFPGLEQGEAQIMFDLIQKELYRIESILSWYDPKSEVSKLNREGFGADVHISNDLSEILEICLTNHQLTNGWFDLTCKPLSLHTSSSSREQLLPFLGMNHLKFDTEQKTVRFESEHLELDFGGVGKGYALDKIQEMTDRFGLDSYWISLGESSVICKGTHPAGGYWPVGVKNPYKGDNLYKGEESLHVFKLNDSALSTSASFWINDDGEVFRHPHIFNPFTGSSVHDLRSVTVHTESATVAEIWSTALLLMDVESLDRIKPQIEDLDIFIVDYQNSKPEVMYES